MDNEHLLVTKADLFQSTEQAFSEIKTERPDSPPESFSLLDAGLAVLKSIRDNPLLDDSPKVVAGMAEIVFAITAAAGLTRGVYGTITPPPVKQLN